MKSPRLRFFLAVFACCLGNNNSIHAQGTVNFIPIGSVYRYQANGTDGGQTWRGTNFNDSNWPSGPAPLGYNQSGLGTVISFGTNANNKHITTYFRHAFTAAGPATSNLLVRLRRDDGAIVYLNGIEVFRSNMPTGAVNHLTLAASEVTGADQTNFSVSHVITGSLLIPGTNSLAAEVHLASPASPGKAFCAELTGNVVVPKSQSRQVPAGYMTFANNLNVGGNTLNELLSPVADGTMIFKWNPAVQNYDSSTYDGLQVTWSPNRTLAPGEGAWLFSPISQLVTFLGQLPLPPESLQRSPAPERRLVSCRWPVASTSQEVLGFPPAEGDRMLFYEGNFASLPSQATRTFTFINGNWSPSLPPLVQPGQAVFVELVAAAPEFVEHPFNQTVTGGTPVTLSGRATGVAPLSYQWFRNSQLLPGFTIQALSFPSVSPTNSGAYSLRAANAYGEAFSSNALLTVLPPANNPPTIIPPSNLTIQANTSTTLAFAVGDVETAVTNLIVTAASANQVLIPNASLVLGGFGANRTVRISPSPNQTGTSLITLRVQDGGGLLTAKSFLVTVANFSPLALTCSSNKTIQCGTPLTFDPPAPNGGCCSNFTINPLLTLTNSNPCLTTYTRVWVAADCCSSSVTCTQIVSVVDTTKPVLLCADDKIVGAGLAWNFDPPTATDSCCGSNVTVTVLNTETNPGSCLTIHTRTWLATDCCSNSTQCSQIVTVLGSPPVNDLCSNAIPVLAGSPAACGSTICATPSPLGSIPPPCGGSADTPDVWYTFTPQCDGPVTVDTCGVCTNQGAPFDTVLSIYSGSCEALTQLACNDDTGGACGLQSRVTFTASAGTTYRIRVSGFAGTTGQFRLNVNQTVVAPPNDFCDKASIIGNGTYSFSNCGANTDGPGGTNCLVTSDVWFRYQAACSGPVQVDTCSSLFTTALGVYSGGCSNLNLVACNDNATAGPCAGSQESFLTFDAVAGASYLIRVGGAGGATGAGWLTVSGSTNCVPQSHVTFAAQPSDIRLRLDRLVYGPSNSIAAELDLGTNRLAGGVTYLLLISEQAGDVEVVTLQRNTVELFLSTAAPSLDFGSPRARHDDKLQVQHGDTIWAFWQVAGLSFGGASENIVGAYALAADDQFSYAPQQLLPELALTADEKVIPPGGKPLATLLVQGTSPLQVPVDELIVYPKNDAQLNEIVSLTGGTILATDVLPEDVQSGRQPRSYLVRVDTARGDAAELPPMRAFINSKEPLFASSEAGLRIVALALDLQLRGYPVGLNPRLQPQGVPQISAPETANLPGALTHPVFDFPRVWSFMAIMDRDTRRIPVAFLDQGFDVNRDFRRSASGAVPQCDFEGRTFADLLGGLVCVPGRAESTPTTGASLVGAPVWHGNGVVAAAGAVVNNGYGVAGTGGQVVEPLLYRYGLTSYAFEMGLGMRKAVWDGASVINLSASFPCRIVTWLGLDPNWCDPLGRTAFCLELPIHVGAALGNACADAVDCDVPIVCDIVEGIAGLVCSVGGASISLGTLTPACLATVPLFGDLRNPLHEGIEFATEHGVPVVTVAGNKLAPEAFPEFLRPLIDLDEQSVDAWQIEPAMHPDTIVCGSAQADFPFANVDFFGDRVDIWAPIPSAYFAPISTAALEPDDLLHVRQELHGTSAAAPYIAGLIADMMALNPRLDRHNPALTAEQRRQIPALIKSLLRDRSYSPEQLTALAPAGDLRTQTAEAGAIRRRLVNPLATLQAAAFEVLDGMTAPALPDFTSLDYDANLNFDETDPAVAADTVATARSLAPGDPVRLGTILTLRGESGTPASTDRDLFRFAIPPGVGVWRAIFELTELRDFESVQVQTLAGESLAGTRAGITPFELTTRYSSPVLFAGANSYVKLSGASLADNVYKFRVVGFESLGAGPGPDRFDANRTNTPPESRPNNNVEARGVHLGRPGEFAWRADSLAGTVLRTRTIAIRDLNFHTPGDVDWFCVVPPPDFDNAACGSDLTIEAGLGVHIRVYHRGLPAVVAEGSGRVTIPASLLFGSELCIELTAEDTSRPLNYNLAIRITILNDEICEAAERVRSAAPEAGGFGFIGSSGHLPFPGIYPGLPSGRIPRCDPRVCDPSPADGARALDGAGRIISPDFYLMEWRTFGDFDALVEFVAGAALRVQLLDAQGNVVAEAVALSDQRPADLARPGGLLHLHRDMLLPGYYYLKFDHGFPGTLVNVVLSRAALFGGLAYEDIAPVRPQMHPPSFDDWARAAIPEGQDRNAAGDPDGDGWNNYQELVFGSNPMIKGDARPPSIQLPGNGLTGEFEFRFTHPTWFKEADYHLEGAHTLSGPHPWPWQTIRPGQVTDRPVGPGLVETVWRVPWPPDYGFFRPVVVPRPTDPPSGGGESLRVGFFNVQFLAEPFTDDSPCCDGVDNRAERIANRIINTGYDVIAIAEAFTSDIKDTLIRILRPSYRYYVEELDDSGVSVEQDSGLMLFSKHPFAPLPSLPDHFRRDVSAFVPAGPDWTEWGDVAFAEFDEFDVAGGLPFPDCFDVVEDVGGLPVLAPRTTPCWGPDCLAAKGAGLVRLQHSASGRFYNVVFTHLDADDQPCDVHVREEQLKLIERMVREVLGTRVQSEPLIIMGDLNVIGNDSSRLDDGIQRTAEWLSRFGPDGQFVVHLGSDGAGSPLALDDLWELQNHVSDGLDDDCRDNGLTASLQYSAEGRSRLDYIFFNGAVVQDLAVQHIAVAYGLKDMEPFHPVAFGDEGRQILSDHIGLIADLNLRRLHCTPMTAQAIGFSTSTPEGPVTVEDTIGVAGGMKWYRINAPGTYTFRFSEADAGIEYQVYATFDLSRPLRPDPAPDDGTRGGAGGPPPQPTGAPGTLPFTYTSPSGCPLLIRVSHRDRNETGTFKLEVRRHLGLTKETALKLDANAPLREVPIVSGLPGETRQRWFWIHTERANSGRPQNLQALLQPLDGAAYRLKWFRASGDTLAEGFGLLNPSFEGGEETYLLVEFPEGAAGFRIQWSTDLTVLLTDDRVFCADGNDLAIRCQSTTGGFLEGEDDDVKLTVEIRRGSEGPMVVFGPVLVRESWDEGQRESVARFFTESIRFVGGVGGEEVFLRLTTYDTLFLGDDETMQGTVVPLGREFEFNCRGSSTITDGDGSYQFMYRLGHRSQ